MALYLSDSALIDFLVREHLTVERINGELWTVKQEGKEIASAPTFRTAVWSAHRIL